MIKLHYICFGLFVLTSFSIATQAQLSANPWATVSPAVTKVSPIMAGKTPNTLNSTTPAYVGSNTTWNTAMGQDMIAPDVNITNMLLMTQHLRNMGYQIPDGIDNLINTAPAKLRKEIMDSMIFLKNSGHPVATGANAYSKIFEKKTGLSIENLIMNSIRIIDARR